MLRSCLAASLACTAAALVVAAPAAAEPTAPASSAEIDAAWTRIDLNPQIDMPKDKILGAVRANVRDGNKQISLATEDMFIWGQVHTSTPFYFPNREALLDLYSAVVDTPGVEQHVLSHATIAPAEVDPILIERLSDKLLDKSPTALALAKQSFNVDSEQRAGVAELATTALNLYYQTDEAMEGRNAFVEKRPVNFKKFRTS